MNRLLTAVPASICALAALSSCVHIKGAGLTLAVNRDLSCTIAYEGQVYSAESDEDERRAEMRDFFEAKDELASDAGEAFRLESAAIELLNRTETGGGLIFRAASDQFIDALNLFDAFDEDHPPIASVKGETLEIQIPVSVERARDEDASRRLPLTRLVVSHPGGFINHNAHDEADVNTIPTLTWDIAKLVGDPVRFSIALVNDAARNQALRLRPPAGTNLQELAARLEDGDRVQLAAGEYPGRLLIENKRLVITGAPNYTSILTGTAAEKGPTVVVDESDGLMMTGVVLRAGREDGTALYITGSPQNAATGPDEFDVLLDRCYFEGPAANGCVARGLSLYISKCTFQRFGDGAICADDGSRVEIADCWFADSTGPGVNVRQATVAMISGCTFERLPGGVVIHTDPDPPARKAVSRLAYPIYIASNTFRNLTGTSPAITVISGRRLNVSGNSLLDTGDGVEFMPLPGDDGESVFADNTIISSRKGGIFVQGKESPARVAIESNFIVGPGQYGIRVNGEGDATIADNVVLSETSTGISIRNGAAACVTNNHIIAPERAVVACETDPDRITFGGNFVIGPCTLDVGTESDSLYAATQYLNTHPESRAELIRKMVRVVEACAAMAVGGDADEAGRAWRELNEAIAEIKRKAA
ncbi:MAG: right-handed parallel beta-helix repeat-containing protein [Phycisphaerales bacterium]|nr:MAG: right-handed parallel beta-helix repeat-containing protein [Phycisphaerales bacterium]